MVDLITDKILDENGLRRTVARWRLLGHKIVFTNGCFDLLHYGHLHYLAAARALGDKLMVGLNSTNSVRRLKGENRPIQDERTRRWQLASLLAVDAIIEFSEDTPLKLIRRVKPDVLVKGGDYSIEQIVGAELVQQYGGLVQTLPFVAGYSTSRIEKAIWQRRPRSEDL